jgi:hypothetical protein
MEGITHQGRVSWRLPRLARRVAKASIVVASWGFLASCSDQAEESVFLNEPVGGKEDPWDARARRVDEWSLNLGFSELPSSEGKAFQGLSAYMFFERANLAPGFYLICDRKAHTLVEFRSRDHIPLFCDQIVLGRDSRIRVSYTRPDKVPEEVSELRAITGEDSPRRVCSIAARIDVLESLGGRIVACDEWFFGDDDDEFTRYLWKVEFGASDAQGIPDGMLASALSTYLDVIQNSKHNKATRTTEGRGDSPVISRRIERKIPFVAAREWSLGPFTYQIHAGDGGTLAVGSTGKALVVYLDAEED